MVERQSAINLHSTNNLPIKGFSSIYARSPKLSIGNFLNNHKELNLHI